GLRVRCLTTPALNARPIRAALEAHAPIELLIGFYIAAATATAERVTEILQSGNTDVVLVDRFIYSTMAPALSRQVSLPNDIQSLFEPPPFRPTCAFLVRTDETVRRARLAERKDAREWEYSTDAEILARVIQAYDRFPLKPVWNVDGQLNET